MHPPKMVRIEIFIDEILCLMAVVSIKWLRVVMFRTQGLSRSAKTLLLWWIGKVRGWVFRWRDVFRATLALSEIAPFLRLPVCLLLQCSIPFKR